MERLTCNKLKTIYDGYFVNFASKEEAAKYRMLVEAAPKYEEIYRKLAEYEDAEEQGLLLKLNLKAGDDFWELNNGVIYPRKAHSLQHVLYCMDRLGVLTFLTEKDAKQALEKMEEV